MKEDSHQLHPNYPLMRTSAGESLTRNGWSRVLTGFLHLISRTGYPNHPVAYHQQLCLWSYFWTFRRSVSVAQSAQGELSNYWDESLESQGPMVSHKCCSEICPITIIYETHSDVIQAPLKLGKTETCLFYYFPLWNKDLYHFSKLASVRIYSKGHGMTWDRQLIFRW